MWIIIAMVLIAYSHTPWYCCEGIDIIIKLDSDFTGIIVFSAENIAQSIVLHFYLLALNCHIPFMLIMF